MARTNTAVVRAGTDDANVWVTRSGGGSWSRVDATLPERWVTRVAVDPTADNVSYVTLSGFRLDEPNAHVFRSTDYGATWTGINSNLPDAPVNDIVVDIANPQVLYVATDVGVYWSGNQGGTWQALGTGLPNVVVNDLRLHHPTRTLVAGTYGRSLWKFDLSSAVAVEEIVQADAADGRLWLHAPAPNPLVGGRAVLRYALPQAADVRLRVFDVSGRVVANLEHGPRAAGTHSAAWDGRNDAGQRVTGGVYFARLESAGVARTRKITVLGR